MHRIMKLFYIASVLLASLGVARVAHAVSMNTSSVLPSQMMSHTDEHVVWRRAPIEITLPVGKERFVSFPSEVQLGYNTQLLPASILRVENDNRTLYLLAKKTFRLQRTEAKLADGEIILLDIQAKPQADDSPVDITLPAMNHKKHRDTNHYASQASVNYVSLTRYAIQQLYTPKRLLSESMGITRFPMETAHVAPLFYDGSASAMPLASWRGGNLYVTALLIKNRLNQPLRLDPRLLCGNWKAASGYPQTTLASRGTPINRDTSTLFVVSSEPFEQAIQACLN